jgi:hypothetical protein
MSEKAVFIEIAGSDRLPSRSRIGAHGPATDQGVPVHLPDRGLAGARVLPQDVGKAVVIEIAGSNRFPGRPRIGADWPAADQGAAAHVPNRGLSAARVLKKDVGGRRDYDQSADGSRDSFLTHYEARPRVISFDLEGRDLGPARIVDRDCALPSRCW